MDDIQKAVKTCLAKYVDFQGRAARPEFWWFALFQIIVMVLAQLLGGNILYGLASLALLLPSLSVSARRLHDVGKSGWMLLILLIPVIGLLVLLYFFAQPSVSANGWGEPESMRGSPAVVPGPGQQ